MSQPCYLAGGFQEDTTMVLKITFSKLGCFKDQNGMSLSIQDQPITLFQFVVDTFYVVACETIILHSLKLLFLFNENILFKFPN